jgi:hypothetical protein
VSIKTAPTSKKSSGIFGKPVTRYEVGVQLVTAAHVAASKGLKNIPVYTQLRRYSDFIDYHYELTKKFPYFLVPNLPPKQSNLSEKDRLNRQAHLMQWLQFVLLHPIIQQASLTKAFLNDRVLDWTSAAQSGGNGLAADDFLYEVDDTDETHKDNKDTRSVETETVVSPIFNKFTEAARYKCIRDMHTIAR